MNICLTMMMCFLVVSCERKKEQETTREPLQEAYQMIDRNDPSGAIEYLEKLQKKDSRPQVKVALASAYAARGGVRVENYWGFVVGFKAPVLNIEKIENTPEMNRLRRILNQMDGQLDPSQMDTLGGLTKALSTLEVYRERIESIPEVPVEKRSDIQHAIEVLKDISTRGGRLYRSILELIVIRTQLSEGLQAWSKIQVKFDQVALLQTKKIDSSLICIIDLEGYRLWLSSVADNISHLANDMAEAFPSRKEEYLTSVSGLQKAIDLSSTSWGRECQK